MALAAALGVAACPNAKPRLPEGEAAPDFQAKLLSGSPFKLSGLKGKVALLDFWATWCGPCEETIPHLAELYKLHRGRGLEVVGVSLDDAPEDVPDYVRSHAMPYPIFVDEEKAVMDLYGVRSVPTTVLVDRKGRIRGRWLGAGPEIEKELDAAIATLLDEGAG